MLMLSIALAWMGMVQAAPPERVGDTVVVTRRYETASIRSDGGSSSSRGLDVFVERVVAVRPDGVELEFDLPADASADERARQWALPARVFWPHEGGPVLLDVERMEARVEAWLARAEMTREACGRWLFTWNAFQIECDPQSIVPVVAALRFEAAPTPPFVAPVDEADIRRDRAEADRAIAQLSGDERLSLETAMAARAAETVSGETTTDVVIEDAGRIARRTRVTVTEIIDGDGVTERETKTQTLERRRAG